MLYYELPQLKHIFNPATCVLTKGNDSEETIKHESFINQSLHQYLETSKRNIHNNLEEWDIMKKYTNPYEFIHTGYDKCYNKGVSLKKPLSRAYYKMIEMIHFFDLFEGKKYVPINSFHLAEGPGGFIEAVCDYRKCKEDTYIGMTLENDCDQNIPGWRKSKRFLESNSTVSIEKGPKENGDLYDVSNYKYITQTYSNNQFIVTADGGFDFSHNYNSQEYMMVRLLLTQVLYALTLQKQGGHFVLKIFDILQKPTCDIMFILCMFYNTVSICKPQTSRIANSEKYVVCKGFKYANVRLLYPLFASLLEKMNDLCVEESNIITSVLTVDIPLALKNKLIELNAVFGQQQIENIKYTIQLINEQDKKYDKINRCKKHNLQKALEWCTRYKIPCVEHRRNNIFKPGKRDDSISSCDSSSRNTSVEDDKDASNKNNFIFN
jgi:23S rRNA U2552 (ribose-2'-O)-methylase RlmE/FtsJ